MTIAVTTEQQSLQQSVRRWAERHLPIDVARSTLEVPDQQRPDAWQALAAQGLVGIHLDEAFGGGGGTVVDAAIVLEELGRCLAPGPVLTTMLAAHVIGLHAEDVLAKDLVPRIVAGELAVGAGWRSGELRLVDVGEAPRRVVGTATAVLAANTSDLVLLPALDDEGLERWVLLDTTEVQLETATPLDWTRPVSSLEVDLEIDGHRVIDVPAGLVGDLAITLLAAEAAGVAGWCLDEATSYAMVRRQFDRPIGSFQAVKHRCAEMLVAVEEARAVAWDAAVAVVDPSQRHVAATVAAAVAFEAAAGCAKDCIQLHGGIGFTWEHDAHLYLRRATATRQLVGRASRWRVHLAELAGRGVQRTVAVEVGDDGGQRTQVRELVQQAAALEGDEQRRFLVDHGFLAPHWPKPWGRDASPQEQLVIEQELREAGVKPPPLVMGDWVLPTLIAHGSAEQQDRFIRSTLLGEITWCQMFSEPGAGSDLAGLATRAERVDGGWELTGQKVWTSIAQWSDWAICLARTNPEAPKHDGITYFLVDMSSPGIDIRPLRELTGHAMFNEVFLDQVFVPDDCVVGQVDDGWRYARTTLDSERVAIGSGIAVGDNVRGVVDLAADLPGGPSDDVLADVGRHVARETTLTMLGLRLTLRALAGIESGPTSSVRKLVSAHHKQDVAELGLELLGPGGAVVDGAGAHWSYQFLLMRSFTIFGGTSEIQRNVIAERILGLPRDEATTR